MTDLALDRELRSLHEKYVWMRKLRRERDADLADGSPHRPDRDELRALARLFPGSLAEIDRISPELLDNRISELALLVDRETPEEEDLPIWIRGWIAVHDGLRGALAVKAWLGGVRTIDVEMTARFDRDLGTLSFPESARHWRPHLAAVANPPGGRLVDLVLRRAGAAMGIAPEALRSTLMPRPPRG